MQRGRGRIGIPFLHEHDPVVNQFLVVEFAGGRQTGRIAATGGPFVIMAHAPAEGVVAVIDFDRDVSIWAVAILRLVDDPGTARIGEIVVPLVAVVIIFVDMAGIGGAIAKIEVAGDLVRDHVGDFNRTQAGVLRPGARKSKLAVRADKNGLFAGEEGFGLTGRFDIYSCWVSR